MSLGKHSTINSDWMSELRNALRTPEAIATFFDLPNFDWPKDYPILIPQNFATTIKQGGPGSPLWKQFLPDAIELNSQNEGYKDPIGDLVHQKTAYLIHRYVNRALLLSTPRCPVICRYCFRKNELPTKRYTENMDSTWDYLRAHPEINEVILSGGDPFILSDARLQNLLEKISEIPTIYYLRFHTRTPIILPSRFTDDLCTLLSDYKKKFHQLLLVIHTNHKDELTPSVLQTIERLGKTHNISLLSQTVLLRGVNNHFEDLLDLFNLLLSHNIRPYYLHHPDQVKGGLHFSLPLEEGRKLYQQLRSKLPGWGIPRYILDLPGGEGKIEAFNPEGFAFSGTFLNFHGEAVSYTEHNNL